MEQKYSTAVGTITYGDANNLADDSGIKRPPPGLNQAQLKQWADETMGLLKDPDSSVPSQPPPSSKVTPLREHLRSMSVPEMQTWLGQHGGKFPDDLFAEDDKRDAATTAIAANGGAQQYIDNLYTRPKAVAFNALQRGGVGGDVSEPPAKRFSRASTEMQPGFVGPPEAASGPRNQDVPDATVDEDIPGVGPLVKPRKVDNDDVASGVMQYLDAPVDAKINLAPLLAYVDSQTGSNLSKGYKPPQTREEILDERKQLAMKIAQLAQKNDADNNKNNVATASYLEKVRHNKTVEGQPKRDYLGEMMARQYIIGATGDEKRRAIEEWNADPAHKDEQLNPITGAWKPSSSKSGDDKSQKRFDDFSKALSAATRYSAVGREKVSLGKAAHGMALLKNRDFNSLTPIEMDELAGVMAQQVTGGVPAVSTLEHMTPKTAKRDLANALQYLKGNPQAANQGAFAELFDHLLERQIQTSLDIIKNELSHTVRNYSDLKKVDQQKYDDMLHSVGIETDDRGNISAYRPEYAGGSKVSAKPTVSAPIPVGTIKDVPGKGKYIRKAEGWVPYVGK